MDHIVIQSLLPSVLRSASDLDMVQLMPLPPHYLLLHIRRILMKGFRETSCSDVRPEGQLKSGMGFWLKRGQQARTSGEHCILPQHGLGAEFQPLDGFQHCKHSGWSFLTPQQCWMCCCWKIHDAKFKEAMPVLASGKIHLYIKFRLVLLFWCRHTQVVLEKSR